MKSRETNCSKDNLFSRLKSAIKSSGLKQKELAKRVGVSAVTLSRYCSGTQTPNRATLNMLAATLGISPEWLLGEKETPTPIPDVAPIIPQNDAIDWKARAITAEGKLAAMKAMVAKLGDVTKDLTTLLND